MNAVCVPHVRTDPAERLHERQRAHAFALEHVVFFVLGLAQVRMQPDMVLPGENGALAQELGRNRKRRAGSQRHLAHGAEGSIMIGFDQARGVLHNFVYCLHHGIGGKAAVLDGQIHRAARAVHADAELRGSLKLRADKVAGASREDIVVIEAGCAAVLHKLTHARQARQADDVGVKVFPDFIERLEPVEQLHVLHLRQVAGELLVQMMVRVDQTWIAEHVARVNGLIGGLVEIWADGADDAVFCIEVDVLIDGVGVVTRDELRNVFDKQRFHGVLLFAYSTISTGPPSSGWKTAGSSVSRDRK